MNQALLFGQPTGTAVFSPCRTYRYFLSRTWGRGKPLAFVMLNPSTADDISNDPTVERCERRAREIGFPGLVVVNLFGLRSTDPVLLKLHHDPVGPANDFEILAAAHDAGMVICAWGVHGRLGGRSLHVTKLLRKAGHALHCLKVNTDGEPAHPLYLPYSLKPSIWYGHQGQALLES